MGPKLSRALRGDAVRSSRPIQATDPAGAVSLEIAVTLCGIPSNPPGHTKVSFPSTAGGPYPAPKVLPPLYDCARSVQILDVHPGSLIQVYSAPSGLPRSNAIVATTTDPVVALWSPLITGEQIYVEVQGCNANGPSGKVVVEPVPDPFESPGIVTLVLSGALDVMVTGVYQGAQVYLLVNGSLRSYVDTNDLESFDGPLAIASGTLALAAATNCRSSKRYATALAPRRTAGKGTTTVVAPAPAPAQRLGSSFDYIFDSNCNNLVGVEVSINITDEVASSAGFTFQLDAYGAQKEQSGWQQYGFLVDSSEIQGFVNNWPGES